MPVWLERLLPIVGLLVAVAILTAQWHFSGGTTYPFAFLYLVQVIRSAVVLDAWAALTIDVITVAFLVVLSLFSNPLPLVLED